MHQQYPHNAGGFARPPFHQGQQQMPPPMQQYQQPPPQQYQQPPPPHYAQQQQQQQQMPPPNRAKREREDAAEPPMRRNAGPGPGAALAHGGQSSGCGRALDNTPAWMAAASSAQAAARAEAAPAAPAAAPADPLPPDWVELPIFYNTVTGATSWERPRLVVMAGDRQM